MTDDMILAGGYRLHDVREQLGTTGALYPEVCNARARDMSRHESALYRRVKAIVRTGKMTRLVETDGYRFIGREGDREFIVTIRASGPIKGRAHRVASYVMRELYQLVRREATRGQS